MPGAAPSPPTGTIFDIKRFAVHDGPGLRTTVFLKGCPLACGVCHNPESQAFGPELMVRPGRCDGCGACVDACPAGAVSVASDRVRVDRARCLLHPPPVRATAGRDASCPLPDAGDPAPCAAACYPGALEVVGRRATVREVVEEIGRDAVFYEESGGGVTFSGGEPLSQAGFLGALLDACRERRFHTVVDSCGYAPAPVFRSVARRVDLFLFDLKVMDEERHRSFTGVGTGLVRGNLRWLAERGRPAVVRFPLIPGVNDDRENVDALGFFLSALPTTYPVDILPYHRAGTEKYGRLGREGGEGVALPDPPSRAAVEEAAGRLRERGLEVTVNGEATGGTR